MVPMMYFAGLWLPTEFSIVGVAKTVHASRMDALLCVSLGVIGGLIIGLTTEYFTSKEFKPTLELVESTRTGASTNIIYGLSLG